MTASVPDSTHAKVTPVYLPHPVTRTPGAVRRIGFVCGDALYIAAHVDPRERGGLVPLSEALPLGDTGADLGALAVRAFALQLSALYLLPACGVRASDADAPAVRSFARLAHVPALASRFPEYEWSELSTGGADMQLAGLIVRRLTPDRIGWVGGPLCIYAPLSGDAWRILPTLRELPPDPGQRAAVIACGLALASYALCMQLRFSPSYVGLTMLRETLQPWAARKVAIAPMSAEWLERIYTVLDQAAVQFSWARAIEAGEEASAADPVTVWHYDRNSSFVSSARAVPVGDPREVSDYLPKQQGVYELDADAPDGWPRLAPGPFYAGPNAYPRSVRGVWAWEPQIRLAIKQGWHVRIRRGYAWEREQTHELLRAWQGRIWDARRACAPREDASADLAAALALATRIVKQVGVSGVGRLGQREGHAMLSWEDAEARGAVIEWPEIDSAGRMTGRVQVRQELTRTDLQQPAWWALTVANATERLQSGIYGAIAAGVPVLGGHVDSYYTLAPLPDFAGDPLKVGGWRLEGFGDVPREALERGTPDVLTRAAKHAEASADGADGADVEGGR